MLAWPEISRVVIGVDSRQHLVDILEAADGPPPALPDGLRTNDLELLNPTRWTVA